MRWAPPAGKQKILVFMQAITARRFLTRPASISGSQPLFARVIHILLKRSIIYFTDDLLGARHNLEQRIKLRKRGFELLIHLN